MATIIGSKTTPALFKEEKAVGMNVPALIDSIDIAEGLPVAVKQEIARVVDAFDIVTIAPEDIGLIGRDQEIAFGKVLDTFLDKIDEIASSKLGEILNKLSKAVDEQDLDELAKRIINNEPGLLATMKGWLKMANSNELREKFLQDTKTLLSAKTGSLKATIDTLEKTLTEELSRLSTNVTFMGDVQTKYGEHFIKYLVEVATIKAMVAKSEIVAEQTIASLNDKHVLEAQQIELIRGNLEKLQSRALALEGTLGNLPADNMVITQLKDACITTRQELLTTIPSKFNRIKMTIIKLNGAIILKGVQDINAQSDHIDKALEHINKGITKEVVTTASNLAGNNRIEQANHVLSIVRDTRELNLIAQRGHESNRIKFADTAGLLRQARGLLLSDNGGSK